MRLILAEVDELKANMSQLSDSCSPPRVVHCETGSSHPSASMARCSMSEFLVMSQNAKRHIPHLQAPPAPMLCIRDATILELIYLIHGQQQKLGAKRNLGPYTLQQAVCLHFASRCDVSDSKLCELEDKARIEDVRLASISRTLISSSSTSSSESKPDRLM